MGEVLAVVASGAGLASLGGQLFDGIVKLKHLYSTVKDAPAEVTNLLEGLSLHLSVLQTICTPRHAVGPDLTLDPNWNACYQHCLSANRQLNSIIKELEISLNKNKHIGGLKFALKLKTLASHREILESTKTTLLLAQQAYMLTQFQSQYDSLIAKIDSKLTLSNQNIPKGSQTALQSSGGCRESEGDLNSADVFIRRRRYKKKALAQGTKVYRLSTWWLGKVIEIETSYACTGWNFSLRCGKILPRNSPIFIEAKHGTVEGIIQLLASKQATPWDEDDIQRNLLHFAAAGANLETCQFLIGLGLDVNSRDLFRCTPFFRYCIRNEGTGDNVKLCRILGTDNGADEIIEGILLKGNKVITSIAALQFMMQHVHQDPRFELSTRLSTALRLQTSVEQFWVHVGTTSIPPEVVDKVMENNTDAWRTLSAFVPEFTLEYFHSDNQPKMAECEKVIKLLNSFEQTMRTPIPKYDSPVRNLGIYFGLYSSHAEKSVTAFNLLLQGWVRWLKGAGLDIQNYGERETAYFDQPENKFDFHPYYSHGIVSFQYGSSPFEWHIWFVNLVDELCGEFWTSVEHPEYFLIPGSWPPEPASSPGERYFGRNYWRSFLYSQRRRKKLRRYLGFPQETDFQVCWDGLLGYLSATECNCCEDGPLTCLVHMLAFVDKEIRN